MDEIEVRPEETFEASEGSEGAEAQKLDDATFEPRAYVELTGDYQQAEAIQTNFVAVTENTASQNEGLSNTFSQGSNVEGMDSMASSTGDTGLSAMGGSVDSLPAMGGGSVESLPAMGGGNVDSMPAMGDGSVDSIPAMGGSVESLPAMGGNVDSLPAMGGTVDSLPAMGGGTIDTLPSMGGETGEMAGIGGDTGEMAGIGGGTGEMAGIGGTGEMAGIGGPGEMAGIGGTGEMAGIGGSKVEMAGIGGGTGEMAGIGGGMGVSGIGSSSEGMDVSGVGSSVKGMGVSGVGSTSEGMGVSGVGSISESMGVGGIGDSKGADSSVKNAEGTSSSVGGLGSVGESTGETSDYSVPGNYPEAQPTTETQTYGSEHSQHHHQGFDGSADHFGDKVRFGTHEAFTSKGAEIGMTKEAIGEGDEGWTPQEMYVYAGSDGKITVVDANGKPLDSPPIVQKYVNEKGEEAYSAYYPGMGSDAGFEISTYTASEENMYIGYDQDGKLIVVDSKGDPVDSPPLITKGVDDNGQETYYAYYQGSGADSGIELGAYSTSLEGCFANIGEDGKVTIVDADGNPLSCQPITSSFVDEKGVEQITAYYPGSGASSSVELQGFSASLEGCYANIGQDGKVTIVDADGNPLSCQPITSKYVDEKGVEQITAYYSGSGADSSVEVSTYSASLEGCYANIGQDGKVTIVDADGNPLSCQPITSKFVDEKGVEQITAYYSGTSVESSVEVPGYSASLQGFYAHLDQDGTVTVVDAAGKPLSSQPIITKYMDAKGNEQISAYYPTDQAGTIGTLSWYKPASGSTGV